MTEREAYVEYTGWRMLGLDRNADLKGKDIPADVLADRDRRLLLTHASITARHFGDPLPGYSAAERKQRISSPSIVPDPLNGLIFRRNAKKIARYG